MIPQSFIQELLARVDIVDVVGKHVKLKKGGANWLGLCPFHGEKSPSFTVSPTKQFYHCFGCGAHGSAIGFLMEHAGLGYVDAIHELARSLGLSVPEERGPDDARRRDPDLLSTLEAAARFYRQRLKDAPAAIEYLKSRGVSGETALRFGIGYAPEGWRGLEAAVPDYSAKALVESGLVIEPEADEPEGGRRKRYDRFRDRIMFPIRNPRGQVIGFGGRVLGQGEPKYLNSPETPLFSKGRELYGLFEGREAIRRADCAIVVEGYMDVVMLAQHGVGHAVATLGTATTAQHVQKLLRLVERVVFAFDGDAAGRRAAWRALEACLPHASDTKRVDFLFL
ncbi:MAG TPA: DNA primase, partial [Burkholderiaceae bacterium]|nr:DNA primase [Burkholderiaceae bacterium]